ncbi:hypothetical protein ED855_19930, partial [Acinetobacter baumannii]
MAILVALIRQLPMSELIMNEKTDLEPQVPSVIFKIHITIKNMAILVALIRQLPMSELIMNEKT